MFVCCHRAHRTAADVGVDDERSRVVTGSPEKGSQNFAVQEVQVSSPQVREVGEVLGYVIDYC